MTIATAQMDFRSNDRDGNGKNDFWRADIAGLFTLAPDGGSMIKLIDLSVALADDRPAKALPETLPTRTPKAGFWFRALRFADEKTPDPDRFAVCCFPAEYGPGIRSHYIISHKNVVYKKDLGHGRGIEVYPADPVKEGWQPLD